MADIYIGNVRDPKALLFGEQTLTDDDIKQVFKNLNLFDKVFPEGFIYISCDDVSPAELFGGNWEPIKDCFLLASGDVYTNGTTGGSADAVVVRHDHYVKNNRNNNVNYDLGNYVIDSAVGYSTSSFMGDYLSTDKTGEDGTGKNMPPYLTVNVWKRVADKVV
jgi:hypothetical protein